MSFGGGSKTQKAKTVSKPWDPTGRVITGDTFAESDYRDWWNRVGSPEKGLIGRAWAEADTDRPFFPGQTFAGFDPLQQEAQTGLANYARGGMQQGVGQYQQTLQDMMAAPANVADNPAVQAMIERNRREAQRMLGSAGRGAIAAGQLGGSRQGVAEAEAIGRMADANAATMLGAFGDLTRQATGAAGLMPGALRMGADPYRLLGQVGAQRQGMAQQGIDEQMARYMHDQNEAARKMNILASAAGAGSGFGTSTTRQDVPKQNTLANIAGIGLGALGMPWGDSTIGGALGGWLGGLFS